MKPSDMKEAVRLNAIALARLLESEKPNFDDMRTICKNLQVGARDYLREVNPEWYAANAMIGAKEYVLRAVPNAFVHHHGVHYQIRRPNPTGFVKWSPLCGVEYTEEAAWRTTARIIRDRGVA